MAVLGLPGRLAYAASSDPGSANGGGPDAPPPLFAYAIGRIGAAVVVTLHGELVGQAVTQLEHVFDDLIRGQGNLTVVVDLRDVTGIDCSALAVLSAVTGWAHQRGGTFRMQEPSPFASPALEATKETEALHLVG